VPQEWSAIPGHLGDVGDETVKRPRVLCHVGLCSLLTDGGSRLGRGWVDKAESPRSWGTNLVVSFLEGGRWQTVRVMACIVTGFHPPSRDGQ
jgi:hypothetical protein